MKLKSYSNKGDHLYRNYIMKSKKKKSFISKLPYMAIRFFYLFIIIFLIVLGISYFFKTNSIFKVKNIKIVVANEKTSIDSNILRSFKGKNLNSLTYKDISEYYDNKNSEYGLRNIQRQLPSTLKVVLYRRLPIFLVNKEWVINNDLSVYHYTEKCVNYIPIKAEICDIKSIFDIPGLPTIHKNILKNRDIVKSMSFEGQNIYIRLKNQKLIVISAGQSLPSLKDAFKSDYKVLDFRFNNAIYVKK